MAMVNIIISIETDIPNKAQITCLGLVKSKLLNIFDATSEGSNIKSFSTFCEKKNENSAFIV